VLKPAGIVLITTPNALRLGSRLRLLRGQNVFANLESLCFGDPYSVHFREYSLNEVVKLLQWGGFRVIVQQSAYLYPVSGIKKMLKRAVEKISPSLAGNLFVVGIK